MVPMPLHRLSTGGSWVVISYTRVYKSPNVAKSIGTLLITPFITTHEPLSRGLGFRFTGNP